MSTSPRAGSWSITSLIAAIRGTQACAVVPVEVAAVNFESRQIAPIRIGDVEPI